jgi:hypothetical protein
VNSGFGLNRVAGVEPGIKAAFDGEYILETVFQEYLRRPGAGGFPVSGAVGNDKPVVRQLIEVLIEFGIVDAPRSRYLYIRFVPGVLTSGVDKENRFAPVQSFLYLGRANPFEFHLTASPLYGPGLLKRSNPGAS